MDELKINGKKIKLVEGNIALLDVDAVVNAANKNLILGGGVAGAIKNYGGPVIQEECNRLAPINVGEAALTSGGNLKARYVIHAVGPVWGEGDEERKLANATLNSLKIASEKRLKSIAFPAISTGVFGFPLKRCSEIMLDVAFKFLKENQNPEEIIFCLYGKESYEIFEKTLQNMASSQSF